MVIYNDMNTVSNILQKDMEVLFLVAFYTKCHSAKEPKYYSGKPNKFELNIYAMSKYKVTTFVSYIFKK